MSAILDEDMNFDKIFWIATTAMRLNRSHPYIARDKLWRTQFTAIFILSLSCFLLLLYSILFHDIQCGLFAEASKNAIMAIVAFTITYKYSIMLRYQDSITELIRIVDDDYKLAKGFCEEEQRIILHYSLRGVKVCQYWIISACSTSAIFPLKALMIMGKSYMAGEFQLVPMFELTYPWILEDYKNVHIMFIMLFGLALFFDVYATSMYVGFDPIVPIFMLHLCGQLDILKLRISKLFSDTEDSEEIVRKNLGEIILKLQDIYRFIEVIKTNFTVLYEFMMKTTTFLLPLTAFQITESLRNGEINFEFIGFFTGVILHFFIPCYYSDLLMETGENFRLAIYSCGWEKHSDMRVLRTILFMLTRAIKPVVICTIFCAICLDTFAEMCREAYSIFNLMNAAWA
ncbi:odorant receptor 2a-like [Leguminivora glycinivorella]|uniref:odorant receptor 2a-like n=1 Tax=Leguminivora glycinivorella TaxID=1035111 RepID=UPI00200FD6DB|nr:odorant receptor 2a-like [Leguminivora glycinivorella]